MKHELALATYNNQEYQGRPMRVTPSIVKQHMAVPLEEFNARHFTEGHCTEPQVGYGR